MIFIESETAQTGALFDWSASFQLAMSGREKDVTNMLDRVYSGVDVTVMTV